MNRIEEELMLGMISILNESQENLAKEQYEMRLMDLKQMEEENKFMYVNSPNCPIDMQSVIKVLKTDENNLKECSDTKDIIEFVSKKDSLAYMGLCGAKISILYKDGVVAEIETDNSLVNIKNIYGIPYNINKKDVYIVQGRVGITDRMRLFVHSVTRKDNTNLRDNLNEAKDLGFDIIPNWFIDNLNPKNLQGSLDYIFDYADEEGFCCEGVVFKYNDTTDRDGIIYMNTTDVE